MKLVILRQNLKEGLSSIERAVIENNNLPILKNVLIKADGKVKLSATNLEIGVSYITNAKINETGGLTVPFGPLYSIINNSDSERINLNTEGSTLIVKTDNYEAKIQGIAEEEFPLMPKIEDSEHSIEINADILKAAISEISSAAQISELKPELSGVLFDFQSTVWKLAATDSYRLAEKTLLNNDFKSNLTKGLKAIVPLRTIAEVVRIFPNDKKIEIHIDPHQILFKNENLQLISRLIDGTYPDYAPIVPKTVESEVVVERENFLTAVKLVSNFSGKTSDIKLRLKNDSKAVEVYSNNQYLGENNYLIPAKKKGNGFEEISFNWRYLMDGLKSVNTQSISFGTNGPHKPAVLRPVDDTSLFYIVMPLER